MLESTLLSTTFWEPISHRRPLELWSRKTKWRRRKRSHCARKWCVLWLRTTSIYEELWRSFWGTKTKKSWPSRTQWENTSHEKLRKKWAQWRRRAQRQLKEAEAVNPSTALPLTPPRLQSGLKPPLGGPSALQSTTDAITTETNSSLSSQSTRWRLTPTKTNTPSSTTS